MRLYIHAGIVATNIFIEIHIIRLWEMNDCIVFDRRTVFVMVFNRLKTSALYGFSSRYYNNMSYNIPLNIWYSERFDVAHIREATVKIFLLKIYRTETKREVSNVILQTVRGSSGQQFNLLNSMTILGN